MLSGPPLNQALGSKSGRSARTLCPLSAVMCVPRPDSASARSRTVYQITASGQSPASHQAYRLWPAGRSHGLPAKAPSRPTPRGRGYKLADEGSPPRVGAGWSSDRDGSAAGGLGALISSAAPRLRECHQDPRVIGDPLSRKVSLTLQIVVEESERQPVDDVEGFRALSGGTCAVQQLYHQGTG